MFTTVLLISCDRALLPIAALSLIIAIAAAPVDRGIVHAAPGSETLTVGARFATMIGEADRPESHSRAFRHKVDRSG